MRKSSFVNTAQIPEQLLDNPWFKKIGCGFHQA